MAGPHHHHHDHHHGHVPGGGDWADRIDDLVFDGEFWAPVLATALGWLDQLLDGHPVQRVLDLGSGPGVATASLAEAFPDARVLAVDGSPELLEQVRARADQRGVGTRVEVLAAGLDDGLPEVDPVDVVWASMVLHHLEQPEGVLRDLATRLRPGGWIVISEFGAPLRMLPDDAELIRSGRWERWHRAASEALHDELPDDPRADWTSRLTAAGFEAVDRRPSPVERAAPLSARDRRWLAQHLRRTRRLADEQLDAADRAAFDELLDPDHHQGVARRPDLFIQASRMIHVGRRPGGVGREP